MIYLDYAATTKIADNVMETYINVSKNFFQHPDTHPRCIQLREEAKESILKNLKLEKYSLVFTSGGTEANNLAIIGYSDNFESQKHFITSSYEHSSVYECFKNLEKKGHLVDYVDPDKNGIINPENIIKLIKKNTVLISIMTLNNELGTINDVQTIAKKIKKVDDKIVFMTDFIQGVGKVEINNWENIDILTLSAHKVYGPKGVGCIIKKPYIQLKQVMFGGLNENGLRPGTQDLAAQVSFAKAIKEVIIKYKDNNDLIVKNTKLLVSSLSQIKQIELNVPKSFGIVNITINTEMLSESIVSMLAKKDIIISTKSACNDTTKISRSLKGLGFNQERANRCYRISVSHKTTKDEIKFFIKILKEIIKGIK